MDAEAVEELRQHLVPKLSSPTLFVECRHPEFRKETEECLGQRALAENNMAKTLLKRKANNN